MNIILRMEIFYFMVEGGGTNLFFVQNNSLLVDINSFFLGFKYFNLYMKNIEK